MKRFRSKDKDIVTFLSKKETLSSLISILIKNEKLSEQFAVVELLTSDNPQILGKFIKKKTLFKKLDSFCDEDNFFWNQLFSFLFTYSPFKINNQLSNNFVKVSSSIIQNRSIEFNQFIKKRKDILEQIINFIGTECFITLLLVIIECGKSLEKDGFDFMWANHIIFYITEKLKNKNISVYLYLLF